MLLQRSADVFSWDSNQRSQDFASLFQLFIRRGVADAEMRVAFAEDVAGDDQHIVLDRLGDELAGGCAGGGLGEDVERAFGLDDFELSAQPLEHQIALAAIRGDGIVHRHIQRLQAPRTAAATGRRRTCTAAAWSSAR